MIRCPTCGAPINADPLDVQPVDCPEPPVENLVTCLPALLLAGLIVAGLVLAVVRLLGG